MLFISKLRIIKDFNDSMNVPPKVGNFPLITLTDQYAHSHSIAARGMCPFQRDFIQLLGFPLDHKHCEQRSPVYL